MMRRKNRLLSALVAVAVLISNSAYAFPNYSVGHIANVTFVNNDVLITLDVAKPDNCAGGNGWLRISGDNKPMVAFVLGLWMRGDLSGPEVTIYTGGLDSSGYCLIGQLDPT